MKFIAAHNFESTLIGSVFKGDDLTDRVSHEYAKALHECGALHVEPPTMQELVDSVRATSAEAMNVPAAAMGADAVSLDKPTEDPVVAPDAPGAPPDAAPADPAPAAGRKKAKAE